MRHPTSETVAWFIDLNKKGQLDIEPPYQRRSVWNQAYRDYFVDTILNNFPMPPVFIYREVDADGVSEYHVVDGRQRLETVILYTGNEFPTPASYARFAGTYFKDLPDEVKKGVWDYLVPVEFLPDINENQLKDIFDRINKNVAQLRPQELRHARFSGEFLRLTERLGEALPPGFPNILESERRRMRDAEWAATLLLYFERGEQSTSQADLDDIYARWDDALPELDLETRFRATLSGLERLVELRPDLIRSRFRNLGDYYSLFAALADLIEAGWRPNDEAAQRLLDFAERVESARTNATDAESDPEAHNYYDAVRSASNDAGPRRVRIDTLKRLLQEP